MGSGDFTNPGFMPHIHCYLDTPSLVWTMFTTDLLIGLSYMVISLFLYLLVIKAKLPFQAAFLAFGLFIFACGGTHFMEVYTMWVPAYWLSASIKVLTAIASLATAFLLFWLRPQILSFVHAAKLSEQRNLQLIEQYDLLQKSEEQFRILMGAVKDYVFFFLDAEGKISSWNESGKNLIQYTPDEIIGRPVSVLYTPEAVAEGAPDRELREAIAQGRSEVEGWRVRKDGVRYWASIVTTPLYRENKLIGFSKIGKDLSERKRFEDALIATNADLENRVESRTKELRESENQFRVLADEMPQLAWLAHPDGYIFWYNSRWYQYTGTTPASMEGWGWESVHHPQELPQVKKAWAASISSGVSFEMEFPLRGADGVFRWFLTRGVPVRGANGEIIRWIGTNTNIDDKKKYQQLELNLKSELEKRVHERTAELESVNNEMQAFSYSVSHDLRAPLRSISGFSGLLLSKYGHLLDDRGQDFLNRIVAATLRMGRLIDDLLKLSRVSRAPIRLEEIDLSATAEVVLAELETLFPERKVEVIIDPHLPKINGDSGLIQIVLQNLFSNAWKYSSKNPHAKIEFGRLPDPGPPVYFIRDNGVGFEMNYADKLFGAFQRLHSEEEFEGTGIGLATVRRIMHRHGGEIWAEAKPQEGATFYFCFKTSHPKGSP